MYGWGGGEAVSLISAPPLHLMLHSAHKDSLRIMTLGNWNGQNRILPEVVVQLLEKKQSKINWRKKLKKNKQKNILDLF